MGSNHTVIVLGAGKFGTCLAQHLAVQGHTVLLVCNRSHVADEINQYHSNRQSYPETTLHPRIQGVTKVNRAQLSACHAIVNAVPVQHHRELLTQLGPLIPEQRLYIGVSKGIEANTGLLPSEMLATFTTPAFAKRAVVLFGPSFAEEILTQQPTAIVAASHDPHQAEQAQALFHTQSLRVYTGIDPLGLEIAGALKNVIAIAAGAARGLGLQSNAQAALITRGLNEILKLGLHRGASPLTFLGLGGIGDLLLTCGSEQSRNFRVGKALGEGKNVTSAQETAGSVAEGVHTAHAAYHWSRSAGLDCPIITTVYQVLYENLNVDTAVHTLLQRPSTMELDEEILLKTWCKPHPKPLPA